MTRDLTGRLWRARRRHDHLDAVLRTEDGEWRLQYYRNNRLLLSWSYPDRDAARADARRRLRELQRAGWTVHW